MILEMLTDTEEVPSSRTLWRVFNLLRAGVRGGRLWEKDGLAWRGNC